MTCKTEREPCPLCERDMLPHNLTKHHLVPKSRGGRVTEKICRTCHRQLHALFSNKELETLNSVEALKENGDFDKYLKWVKNKNPDQYFRGKMTKERRQ
jgi:hypothetical protein